MHTNYHIVIDKRRSKIVNGEFWYCIRVVDENYNNCISKFLKQFSPELIVDRTVFGYIHSSIETWITLQYKVHYYH